MAKIRKAFFLVIISAISVAFLLAQELPQEHHEVVVRLKLLDVIVTDAGGNFILDLSRNDFQLFEDGQLRPIESVELVTLKSKEEILAKYPGEAAQEELKARKRIYVLFDWLNTDPITLRRARDELSRLMLNLVEEGFELKLLALYPEKGLEELCDFSSDRELISQIISALEGNLTPIFLSAERDSSPDQTSDFSLRLQWQDLLQKSLSGFLQLIPMIKEAPGRKTVLLISSGLTEKESLPYLDLGRAGGSLITQIDRVKIFDPFDLTKNSTYPEFLEELVHLANSNLITFYGLQLGQVEEVESNLALSYLSKKTGGAYFRGAEAFSIGEKVIKRDNIRYYEIAYVPASREEDGKFHRVEVKCTREGARVHFRDGYVEYKEQELTNRRLASAFLAPDFYQDIDFEVSIEARPQGQNNVIFHGNLYLPLDQFLWQLDTSKKVTFFIGIKEMNQQKVHFGQEEIDLTEDLQQGKKYLIYEFTTTKIKLKPGRYGVVITVTWKGEKTGSKHLWTKIGTP
ncbi:MAG: VWA domain-containing protein [Acidobacteriota bacterium]|nr:VWA domain-containing protein [Acidobacteriota bacterium]MDW3229497.1 VWA domain-containing protein [Acidobacteriota bacterium]